MNITVVVQLEPSGNTEHDTIEVSSNSLSVRNLEKTVQQVASRAVLKALAAYAAEHPDGDEDAE